MEYLENEEDRLARHEQEVAELEEAVFTTTLNDNRSPVRKESSSNLSEEAEDEVGEENETAQEKSSGRHTGLEPPSSPTNVWGWLRSRKKKKSGNGEVASGEV